MEGLDPYSYSDSDLYNEHLPPPPPPTADAAETREGSASVTPPLTGEGEESVPLEVLAEVREDEEKEGEEGKEDESKEKPAEESETVAKSVNITEDQTEQVEENKTPEVTENEVSKDQESDQDSAKPEAPKLRNIQRNFSRTTSVYMSSRPIYDLFAITVCVKTCTC